MVEKLRFLLRLGFISVLAYALKPSKYTTTPAEMRTDPPTTASPIIKYREWPVLLEQETREKSVVHIPFSQTVSWISSLLQVFVHFVSVG